MYVQRKIGQTDLLVNIHSANEVLFDEEFLQENNIESNNAVLTPSEICELIAKDDYIPMIMSWELLDKCSFKCPFCYIVGHSRNKVVRFREMKPEIDKLIEKGLFHCLLTGGEATSHSDFKEIYKYLKQNGVLVEVYTNGSLIDKEMIELFKEFKPYKIEVSIYGVSQENFQEATGTQKINYQLILDNILELKSNDINVLCKTPLNNLTEKDFDEIILWCKENEVVHYYSTSIYEGYDGSDLDTFASNNDIQNKYDALKFLEIEKKYPTDTSVNKQNPQGKTCYTCAIRKFGLHINSAFELMPCSETHFDESKSKILDDGIDKAIEKYRNFVDPFVGRAIIGCDGCEASKICKMCSAVATPLKNEAGNITDFKVPEGHCQTQREKVRGMAEYLMTE
ncbi:MAG: radical SAM protein [Ferruginibacter sp.]|nr:radical SAM protein [Ferruginibacter sp.]